MNYNEAIKYLDSFYNLEQKSSYSYKKTYSLDRVYKLFDIIGRPQDDFKSILVSGTNGKGSVCAILHSALFEAGYRVALYTSPHLLDLRERIKVNNNIITKNEFAEVVDYVKKSIKCAKIEDACFYKKLTYFEILTAVALVYFSRKEVDFAVVETGLGGRLDATNVVYPLVSVITSVSFDHIHLLGRTYKDIAKEKAGIIKENSFVVSAPQQQKAMEAIAAKAKDGENKLITVGDDVKYKCTRVNFKETTFNYKGIHENYKNIKLSLVGSHQAQNGAIVLAVIEILKRHFYFLANSGKIRKGFRNADWPGRFRVLKQKPCVIVDGAHNKEAVKALRRTLFGLIGKRRVDALILGFSSDKDIKAMGKILRPLAKNIIFTRSSNQRAAAPKAIAKLISKKTNNSYIIKNPKQAYKTAKKLTSKNGIILIAGSLFLVADIMNIINHKTQNSNTTKSKINPKSKTQNLGT